MTHKHTIRDVDPHFKIDIITRAVKNVRETKTVVFQNDHNSEKFTFEIPRYIEEHDLTLCDIVQIHYVNINSSTHEQNSDVYEVDDLKVSPVDDKTVYCSWTISSNATKHVGSLNFVIVFKCSSDEPGKFDFVWHTAIHTGVSVKATINNSSIVVEEYSDILAQWKKKLFGENGSSGTIDRDAVEEIVEEYLTELKESGKLVGKQGPQGEKGDPGEQGPQGEKGDPGEDGKIPEKGVDYFTEEDIRQVAQEAASLVSIDQVLPEQVYFPNGASTTYAIGKVTLTNGMGELIPAGGTLKDFFNKFVDEKNPSKTDPAVSLTFSQAKAYEVGTKVTPTYSASLSAGSYTYGPATGVTASSWSVTDTAGNTARTTASGSFPELTVTDGISYKITAKATHNAGTVPVTNTGNPYTAEQIAAGSKSATSGALTGYRNTFYGTLTTKSDPTSSIVRDLKTKSGKALANGNSFTFDIPVGALRVMIAYPATLRDVTSIKDVNGMNAEISSGFTKKTVDVHGANSHTAISYKVYIMDFANANDKANKFTVQI